MERWSRSGDPLHGDHHTTPHHIESHTTSTKQEASCKKCKKWRGERTCAISAIGALETSVALESVLDAWSASGYGGHKN
jgi:hypothetical protein